MRPIVLLGWKGICLSLSVEEADALLEDRTCRVSRTQHSAELTDATVLVFTWSYLEDLRGSALVSYAYERAWKYMLARFPGKTDYRVRVPLAVG